MWHGRIKPVKSRDGSVLVVDEEGFNNITEANKYSFINRVDRAAASSIDGYACWGKVDYEFWKCIPELRSKLSILGIVGLIFGSLGRAFYQDEIKGLNSIFGSYTLISDNFCVERRKSAHFLPKFNVSNDDHIAAKVEFEKCLESQTRRRNYFASLIEEVAKKYPDIQLILRPHPVADSRWWSDRFADLRNLHIVYHKCVDPWILAARSMISMGYYSTSSICCQDPRN